MADSKIRFDDGAAYEQMMGRWSRIAGDVFLEWLALPAQLDWLDVGCGNGAFTERVLARCGPRSVHGVDPSQPQLDYARERRACAAARFTLGDAMALPVPDAAFDAAVMALVLFFVPDPAQGVAEMCRAVRPGGTVAAYAWDVAGGGLPMHLLHTQMRELGLAPLLPPSADASRLESMQALWSQAGLTSVQTRQIAVERTFADFDDFWNTSLLGASISQYVAAMSAADQAQLRARVRAQVRPDATGRIVIAACANAVQGRVRV